MRNTVCVLLAAAALISSVHGSPLDKVENELQPSTEETLLRKLSAKCSQRDTASCVMLKLVSYMNRLLKKNDFELTESLVITQTSPVMEASQTPLARAFKHDSLSDDDLTGQLVAEKLWAYVQSRSLRWSVLPEADVVLSAEPDHQGALNLGVSLRASRSLETGRGKMKNLGPLVAAGMMKIGMVGVLAFKALALLVGKALLVSKLAFLLAAVIGLKKLFSQQKHVTYEVVTHPHHSHSHAPEIHSSGHDSYSSGWGRSLPLPLAASATASAAAPVDAHQMAYSAQAPAQ
ncbi:hypothetical protein LSTR_LSTR008822 [Laodelphax striatellus]|uniref:Osiris n=1 Tax=Laodelphax striatellus TaxID=195883 RepID=A0A482WT47_LAOST|nr:hypothetical protein LSTR_LSTR008822 [Laodelphax striatellus]